jgi:broad specificity phosphatase PhoE
MQRASKRFNNADRGQRWVGLFVLLAGLGTATSTWSGDELLVQRLLAGGEVLLIRHAAAPGTGDPAGFRLGDCATQRNLSDTGREQARAIGDWLRDRGIERARVYSSQWCRCLETAELDGFRQNALGDCGIEGRSAQARGAWQRAQRQGSCEIRGRNAERVGRRWHSRSRRERFRTALARWRRQVEEAAMSRASTAGLFRRHC